MYGTQTKISATSTSAVTATSKSVAADMDDWANSDDAPVGTFVLEVTFSTNPTKGEAIALFAMMKDVQSTNDMPQVDSNFDGIYCGSFIVDVSTSAQYLVLADAPIPSAESGQTIEYYVMNNTSQTMSAGWDLWVTPKTYGPHA